MRCRASSTKPIALHALTIRTRHATDMTQRAVVSAALRSQLGLTLEPSTAAADPLIVDQVRCSPGVRAARVVDGQAASDRIATGLGMICRGPRITSHSSSGASCVARGHSRRPRRVGRSECLLEADATDLDLELTTHLAVSLIID